MYVNKSQLKGLRFIHLSINKAKDKGILPYEIGQLKMHFMLWKVYAIIINFGGDFFPRACFPFVLFPVLALASTYTVVCVFTSWRRKGPLRRQRHFVSLCR